jgi:hypothetical protein
VPADPTTGARSTCFHYKLVAGDSLAVVAGARVRASVCVFVCFLAVLVRGLGFSQAALLLLPPSLACHPTTNTTTITQKNNY